jgi:hypothetical protein
MFVGIVIESHGFFLKKPSCHTFKKSVPLLPESKLVRAVML